MGKKISIKGSEFTVEEILVVVKFYKVENPNNF